MKLKIIFVSCLLISASYSQLIIKEQIIEDGVVYKKIIDSIDTLSIDILMIDITSDQFELRSVKANNLLNSKETTSKMVNSLTDSGYNVIAAINADFFEVDGEVVNNMISEGKFVKAVKFTDSPFNSFVNSQFVVTKNKKVFIEQFVFTGDLVLPNGAVETIDRINSLPDSNSIVLYNFYEGNKTPVVKDSWFVCEIPIVPIDNKNDTLICVACNQFHYEGETEIKNVYVLSANNKFGKYLEREISPGDTLNIIFGLNPKVENINLLIGGWPRLVKDGINTVKLDNTIEGVIPRFSRIKHPRTGIGISKDSSTVYFITVDGRQESSSGMTLDQFADLMIEEGIYQGLNLDGGGSTTMVIKNKVVNNPSDKIGERKVGNCIMLIEN